MNRSKKKNCMENELKISYMEKLESEITRDLVVRKRGSVWDRDMQEGIGVTFHLGNGQSELMHDDLEMGILKHMDMYFLHLFLFWTHLELVWPTLFIGFFFWDSITVH